MEKEGNVNPNRGPWQAQAMHGRHRDEQQWNRPSFLQDTNQLPRPSRNGNWPAPGAAPSSMPPHGLHRGTLNRHRGDSGHQPSWKHQGDDRYGWMGHEMPRPGPHIHDGFNHHGAPKNCEFGMEFNSMRNPHYHSSMGKDLHLDARMRGQVRPPSGFSPRFGMNPPGPLRGMGRGMPPMVPEQLPGPPLSGYSVGVKRKRLGPPFREETIETPMKAMKQEKMDLKDGKIVLLFDLNGTLTKHTSASRSEGKSTLRPGLAHLLKLKVDCFDFCTQY